MTNTIYDHPTDYDDQYYGYDSDVAFWLEIADRYAGAIPILENAAGTGRVTIPLAKAGFKVHGSDISNAMLSTARSKIEGLGNGVRLNIKLEQGNMIDYKTEIERNLIIVPFTAFQHLLKTEDQLAALINMREQLSYSGRLLIDIQNPSPEWLVQGMAKFKHPIENKRIKLPSGETLVRRQVTHYVTATQQLKWIFYIDIYDKSGYLDHSYTEAAEVAAIFPREWRLLNQMAGLEIEHEYGDYQFGNFEGNSPRMLFVCKKA